jgi:hypothetical protein
MSSQGSRMSDFASRNNIASVVNNAGAAVRYAFYTVGMLVFCLIGFSILKISNFVSFYKVNAVDEFPSFRVVDGDLARLSMQTRVSSSGAIGRIETRFYGQPHDRNTNLTITMTTPPKVGTGTTNTFTDVRNTLVMSAYSNTSSGYGLMRHDLETRFGPVRAAETRISADGMIKPCLTFQSRFETQAVRLDGLYCEATGAKPSPYRLACILDGLTIDGRLASPEAESFLRWRMSQRPNCTSTPVSQTIDTQYRSMSPPSRWSTPAVNRR